MIFFINGDKNETHELTINRTQIIIPPPPHTHTFQFQDCQKKDFLESWGGGGRFQNKLYTPDKY